ncbi:smallish isoform X2 [Musca autumnalis]|uniref:smallish isoform X2 n=1 Tax=Musca autumnalis TaxID=221902 RepID=UPI003CED857E
MARQVPTPQWSITSPDPTAYVAKARVTRPTPPPPPYNPMQFVQIKPCNLYQTAQEQLKKAEEVKKIKEIRKEEPEDWQNNLDNWKSSRRKRVEHIIDRVVEVKKLELEEHDRTRRKSKTFSEMIENRSDRVGRPALKKLASLAVYTEDESNDLSDLGIGTSSASGKSSLSEDYDNNSVMSDNAAELDKAISNCNNHNNKTNNHQPHQPTDSTTREYISSPGYETSSSTAPASTPDPCEYTYEGAIQDYKQRVSRAVAATTTVGTKLLATTTTTTGVTNNQNSKESTPERSTSNAYPPRRGSKIEDRLIGFEVQSPSEECIVGEKAKVDLPKIDISKRKEIFESQASVENKSGNSSTASVPRVTLRDRFKPVVESTVDSFDASAAAKKEVRRLSGDITSIKERLQSLEQQKQHNLVNGGANSAGASSKQLTSVNKLVDVPVPPLKERLSSLQNAVATKEEIRKPPVALVDARQLEIMKSEEEKVKQQQQQQQHQQQTKVSKVIAEVKEEVQQEEKVKEEEVKPINQINETITTTTTTTTIIKNDFLASSSNNSEVDRDDSGIHTADDIDVADDHIKKEQELKLNAAIEALAMEEKQFAEAANAVNQIEAEFEELSLGGSVTLPPLAKEANNTTISNSSTTSTSITNDHMEYSVSSTNPCTPPPSLSAPCNNPQSSCSSSSDNSSTSMVKVAVSPPCNLRRKPTNEMVHAKNLLKIFKDTFKNDIELDVDEVGQHEPETKDIPPAQAGAIKTQIFENQAMAKGQVFDKNNENISMLPPAGPKREFKTPLSPILSRESTPNSNISSESGSKPPFKTPLSPILSRTPGHAPQSPILSRPGTPKLPMSPLTVRSTTKFHEDTPPNSPSAIRKHDSQFSINGRVEIFNSKQQLANDNNTNVISSSATTTTTTKHDGRPTSPPQITTKITYLPHITVSDAAKHSHNSSQELKLPHNEAAPITTETVKSGHTDAVHDDHEHDYEDEVVALTLAEKKSLFEMKSMATASSSASASKQMVNEPLVTIATSGGGGGVKALAKTIEGSASASAPLPLPRPVTPSSKPMKQQAAPIVAASNSEQLPPTEVVVCAPPITIVNPEELPKPNTVKNLSSCFQQSDSNSCGGNSAAGKLIASTAGRGNHSHTTAHAPTTTTITYKPNTTGNNVIIVEEKSDDPLLLSSMISSSTSTSSNTTVCTVIEANKKLSVMSNSSTNSSESMPATPTLVETSAQVHNERAEEEKKIAPKIEEVKEIPKEKGTADNCSQEIKNSPKLDKLTKEKHSSDAAENEKSLALKALLKDFLATEIQFSETCETRPLEQKNKLKTPDIDEVDKATTFANQTSLSSQVSQQKEQQNSISSQNLKQNSHKFQISKVSEESQQQNSLSSQASKDNEENQQKNYLSSQNQQQTSLSSQASKQKEENPSSQISQQKEKAKPNETLKVEIKTQDHIPETAEMLALKESMKDFLNTEILCSEAVETPNTPKVPFESPLQPLKVVVKDTGEIRGRVELPTPTSPKSLKTPLTIDVTQTSETGATSPLSPRSQLFRTTKPLVVTALYDKYFNEGATSPTSSLSNMRPISPKSTTSPSKPNSDIPTSPTIVTPAPLPNLVECPPNDSTLYKLASSAPHSPVSPRSPHSLDMDAALCSNLLTSMAVTPNFVDFQRQHTVEEKPCQKVDVEALPIDKKTPCTGFKDISQQDLKPAQTRIIHKMQDAPAAPVAVDETCLKLDVHSLPRDKQIPTTGFQAISPSELKKRDNLFSSPPHSPIMEARAAHSKALIETCEKIIAEEKQVNNQLKTSLPSTPISPKSTPVLQKKCKIPKPLNSCCTATESMNEADLKNKAERQSSQNSTNKDDAVIARMHVVETQIKVTTTTPPASPKTPNTAGTALTPSPKPQASPNMGKKAKNIFDFIKKNFGMGGSAQHENEEGHHKESNQKEEKETGSYKPLETESETVPPPASAQPLVLSERELQELDTVTYNEIHNIDNSKFYLPSDDVPPPPLPKTPAPVNIEITRKIITDEILEDGKTELEFRDEIDALLDVELNKLNHEIEELDKVAATTTSGDGEAGKH